MKKALPFSTPEEFYVERNFGLKISATFEFLRIHINPLGKSLLYYVVPVPLLGFIGLTSATIFSAGAERYSRFVGGMIYIWPVLVIGQLLLMLTLYGYLILRIDTPRREPVTPRMVGLWIRPRFLASLGAYVVVILLLFCGFLMLAIPGLWLSVPAMLFFMIRLRENLSINDALVRATELVKNNWWSTLGLVLLMSFIGFLIPLAVQTLLSVFGDMVISLVNMRHLYAYLTMAISAIAVILYLLMSSLTLLALAFQYFNLVEQREGVSLYALIEKLGNATPVMHADYSASIDDEEGEY